MIHSRPNIHGRKKLAANSLLGLLVISTNLPVAAAAEIASRGLVLHRLGPLAVHGWGATDVNGDGRVDLVTSAAGPADLILAYGRSGNPSTPRLLQALVNPPDSVKALATSESDAARVVSISADKVATRYGGWPLAPLGSFSTDHAVVLARIGDVDADGTLELLCAGEGKLTAYSLPGGSRKWSMTIAVTDVDLASLDADPALELVIAGGDAAPGYVIDGATLMAEWSRPEGFGTYVAAGRIGDAFEPGFVAARDFTSLSGFSAAPYAPIWSMDNSDTDGVAVGDTDADGRDEFAVGDGQFGTVKVYEMPTRQLLYEFDNRGDGLWGFGMLDLDNDGRDEIWYSARSEQTSNYEDNFAAALMNPINARARLTIESYRQGATATLLADLDRDGQREWVIGTSAAQAYKGILRAVDQESLVEKWRAPYELGNAFLPFQMGYRSLHAASLDDDDALELVAVGGNGNGDFRFLVIDGATQAVERQVPTPISRWPLEVTASRLVQHVPGGAPELLVAHHHYGADVNVGLSAYTLPDGGLVWSSAGLGGPYDTSIDVDVAQLDDDPALEYLLVHSLGLTAFDAVGGQAEWTLPITVGGAVTITTQAGVRIAAYRSEGEVSLYDPATHQATSGFSLPPPLEQLARLPGRDDVLLALSNERLMLIDHRGKVLAESDWIAGASGVGDSLHVVPDGRGWLISLGRSFASFQFRLNDLDLVFTHGFE